MMTKENFIYKFQKKTVVEFSNSTKKNQLVSVLVLAYQHENYIKECLDSILQQKTDFSFEILIGEDESKDKTREICKLYAQNYPSIIRLFLHSRENNIHINGSPSWHFNSLYNIFSANGKYIALCEGDDFWIDPLKLQKQVDFLENEINYSACAHLSEVVFDGVQKINSLRFNNNIERTVFRVKDLLEYTRFHTSSLVYRKKCIENKEESTMLALNRDHPTMILLASKGPIKRLPEVMSVYRRNSDGFSENNNLRHCYEQNIEMANALNEKLSGFVFKSFYIKGHWHRVMMKDTSESYLKKWHHFVYFLFSSFYIFPRNVPKILKSFNFLLFRDKSD